MIIGNNGEIISFLKWSIYVIIKYPINVEVIPMNKLPITVNISPTNFINFKNNNVLITSMSDGYSHLISRNQIISIMCCTAKWFSVQGYLKNYIFV